MRNATVIAVLALMLDGCGEAPTVPAADASTVAEGAPASALPAGPPPVPTDIPAGPYAFTCAEFATVSEAGLIEKFGAANVTTQVIRGSTGQYVATVVLPNHPTHRLEVTWIDSASRSNVESATIGGSATSEWVGVNGLKVGMSLVEVETLNGKPFAMKNLDAYGWDGGAMVENPKCVLHAIFNAANADGEFWSKDERLRAAQPVVVSLKLAFQQ